MFLVVEMVFAPDRSAVKAAYEPVKLAIVGCPAVGSPTSARRTRVALWARAFVP